MFSTGFVDISRISSTISTALDHETVSEALQAIDSNRYAESQLFFDRNWIRILLGDGMGAALIDHKGYFGDYIRMRNRNEYELATGHFYNFHDVWVDYGLRIGLLPVVVLFYAMILGIGSTNQKRSLLSMLLVIAYICQSFSTAGIIVMSYLGLFYRNHAENSI